MKKKVILGLLAVFVIAGAVGAFSSGNKKGETTAAPPASGQASVTTTTAGAPDQTTPQPATTAAPKTTAAPTTTEEKTTEAKEIFKNLELKDSGWYLANDKWLMYYVVLHNPNEKTVVELPTFRITARDANGALLGTDDMTISIVYPGQDFVFGTQAFAVDEMPSRVEFEIREIKSDYKLKDISAVKEFLPLEVVNVAVRSGNLLGEIKNPNDYSLGTAVIVAIMKNADGDIIAIENTYVNDIQADGLTPFSTSVWLKEEPASIECFANKWP